MQPVWKVMNDQRGTVYGPDRYHIGDRIRHGRKPDTNGGVWVPQISPENMRLVVRDYQITMQRKYATQFGAYLATVDGTHGTSKYRTYR